MDYRGVIDQLDRFNAALPPHSVLIFGDSAPVGVGDLLGTPLRFLYGHDVFTLRNADALDKERFAEVDPGLAARRAHGLLGRYAGGTCLAVGRLHARIADRSPRRRDDPGAAPTITSPPR